MALCIPPRGRGGASRRPGPVCRRGRRGDGRTPAGNVTLGPRLGPAGTRRATAGLPGASRGRRGLKRSQGPSALSPADRVGGLDPGARAARVGAEMGPGTVAGAVPGILSGPGIRSSPIRDTISGRFEAFLPKTRSRLRQLVLSATYTCFALRVSGPCASRASCSRTAAVVPLRTNRDSGRRRRRCYSAFPSITAAAAERPQRTRLSAASADFASA